MSRLVVALFALLVSISVAHAETTIRKISVEGTQRVEPQTVVSYLTVAIGDVVDDNGLSESTKALYATGLFSDVALAMEGNTLHVKVAENSLINQVAFEGNDKVKDDDLKGEVRSQSRSVLSRTVVQGDVQRITDLYRRQGRYSASVTPKVIQLDQNRVNLVFEINEGDVSAIKGIKFVGNTAFSDSKLREVVASREEAWYRFLSTSDRYDPDRIAYDEDLLRRFYLRNGYVDFRVISSLVQLSPNKKDFYLTMTVDEGEQYKVAAVNIDTSGLGSKKAPADFKEQVIIKSGETYNADLVEDSVKAMTDDLAANQIDFVAVKPDIQKDAAAKTLALTFKTEPTPKVFVERININGNLRTQDKVVRREFEMAEGDPFNKTRLSESEQNIKDLDFFDKVTVEPKQGSAPDQAVIDVNVQEKSTGEISAAAGLSTEDGPIGDFGIRERNFLGKGQDLKFSTTLSGKRLNFDLSLTEPKFLDRNLSARVDAFHSRVDMQSESSYDQQRTGGGLRFGFPMSKHWSESIGYRLEKNEIKNVQTTASRYIREQQGSNVTSAINNRLEYDDRDSTMFPTKGKVGWLETEAAGLGGDSKYVSAKLGGEKYWSLNRARTVVLSLLGETGGIAGLGRDVRINERYYLGGSTLRGFKYGGIGPRDTTTADALGGNLFYRGSAEMSFPLGLPEELGLGGHLFSDAGSLWSVDHKGAGVVDENALRAAVGAGLSWKSPMGPIRLDFAVPVLDKSYDEKEIFRFNFGTKF